MISVRTSDISMAGTDANIKMVAYGKTKEGEYRKTDDICLENAGDTFKNSGDSSHDSNGMPVSHETVQSQVPSIASDGKGRDLGSIGEELEGSDHASTRAATVTRQRPAYPVCSPPAT